MSTEIELDKLSPKERARLRMLKTVKLLRSNARDTSEAAEYLREEQRLQKSLQHLPALAA